MYFKPLSGDTLKDLLERFPLERLLSPDDEVALAIMAIPDHFSQANIVMGPGATFQFAGTSFVFTRGSLTLVIKDHDSNDSAGPNYDQFKSGRRHLEFDVEGYVQTDVSLPLPPAVLTLGGAIAFYPYGVGTPGTVLSAAATVMTKFDYHAPAQAGDECTIALAGKSTGTIVHP